MCTRLLLSLIGIGLTTACMTLSFLLPPGLPDSIVKGAGILVSMMTLCFCFIVGVEMFSRLILGKPHSAAEIDMERDGKPLRTSGPDHRPRETSSTRKAA